VDSSRSMQLVRMMQAPEDVPAVVRPQGSQGMSSQALRAVLERVFPGSISWTELIRILQAYYPTLEKLLNRVRKLARHEPHVDKLFWRAAYLRVMSLRTGERINAAMARAREHIDCCRSCGPVFIFSTGRAATPRQLQFLLRRNEQELEQLAKYLKFNERKLKRLETAWSKR